MRFDIRLIAVLLCSPWTYTIASSQWTYEELREAAGSEERKQMIYEMSSANLPFYKIAKILQLQKKGFETPNESTNPQACSELSNDTLPLDDHALALKLQSLEIEKQNEYGYGHVSMFNSFGGSGSGSGSATSNNDTYYNAPPYDENLLYGPTFSLGKLTYTEARVFLSMSNEKVPASRGLYSEYTLKFPCTLVVHPYHFKLASGLQYFPFLARKGTHQLTLQYLITPDEKTVQAFRAHHCVPNGVVKIDYTFWHGSEKIAGHQTGKVHTHDNIASPNNFHLPQLTFCGEEKFVLMKATLSNMTYWTVLVTDLKVFRQKLSSFNFGEVEKGKLQLAHLVYFLRSTLKGAKDSNTFFDELSDSFKK